MKLLKLTLGLVALSAGSAFAACNTGDCSPCGFSDNEYEGSYDQYDECGRMHKYYVNNGCCEKNILDCDACGQEPCAPRAYHSKADDGMMAEKGMVAEKGMMAEPMMAENGTKKLEGRGLDKIPANKRLHHYGYYDNDADGWHCTPFCDSCENDLMGCDACGVTTCH